MVLLDNEETQPVKQEKLWLDRSLAISLIGGGGRELCPYLLVFFLQNTQVQFCLPAYKVVGCFLVLSCFQKAGNTMMFSHHAAQQHVLPATLSETEILFYGNPVKYLTLPYPS